MPRRKKPVPEIHPLVGAQKKERNLRNCVHCQRPFSSRCAGNRLCSHCKRTLGDARLDTTYHSELKVDDGE